MAVFKKIVVIGPESTGKSTLCEQLASHYQTIWCPEYAREYLTKNGPAYTFNDLMHIARGQLALETAMFNGRWPTLKGGGGHPEQLGLQEPPVQPSYKSEPLVEYVGGNTMATTACAAVQIATNQQPTALFIDTDLYVMKVWCEYVFNKCHHYILEQIATRRYDLYLLCNIDLPWQPDPLREYPDEKPRQELYRIYKDILANQATPWVTISGNYNERLQTAIAAVDKLLED